MMVQYITYICSGLDFKVIRNVIKGITPDDSKDMNSSKLLGLVDSRAVVFQPWADSNKLAKKIVFF